MIPIATKFRPFTHIPGSAALIPGTMLAIRAYPAQIFLEDWSGCAPQTLQTLTFPGSVDHFALILDLEKKQVRVVGKRLIWTFWGSSEGIWVTINKKSELIYKKPLDIREGTSERLSLGSHRKQEWERMIRSRDLETLLPLWLKMGELLPDIPVNGPMSGTIALLDSIGASPKQWISLIRVGFKSIWAPVLSDDHHLGLCPEYDPQTKTSPLILLKEGAQTIRSWFIQEKSSTIHFLPQLPHEFPAGRMTHVHTESAELSFLWKKKRVIKLIIKALKSDEITLQFTSTVKTYRLSRNTLSLDKPLAIEVGKTYFLDRFY